MTNFLLDLNIANILYNDNNFDNNSEKCNKMQDYYENKRDYVIDSVPDSANSLRDWVQYICEALVYYESSTQTLKLNFFL